MHAFSKAPSLHGRYPASLLLWASPIPHRAAASVMSSRRPLVACASTRQGLPGSSTDLSTRAAPNHPGRSGECLPVASPPVAGFILVGGLATFVFLTRPNRVYLRCGSRVRPAQAARSSISSRACRATCRTGNLHGELLSVHKISQAYPGIPSVSERPARLLRGAAR